MQLRATRLTAIASAVRRFFSPSSLFSAGEQGVWCDPSDLSTLFQDAAGTTPVTAVEQPVGLMLDKSGRGNHATQTTSTSRPVLSARYNLLTKTEQFADSYWRKSQSSVVANAISAPNGSLTADKLVENSANATHSVENFTGQTIVNGTAYTASIYAKAGERTKIAFKAYGTPWGASLGLFVDLFTGDVISSTGVQSSSVIEVGNGWYRIEWTAVPTNATGTAGVAPYPVADSYTVDVFGQPVYQGDGTSGIYIWGASLVPANQADLPYQRVNTPTDYDADPAKFPAYLKFDGVDDFLVTNSIDFTATDKMTVFAGVRKLSDAATGALLENGTNGVQAGITTFAVPSSSSQVAFASRGTAASQASSGSGFAAPITGVLTGIGDISGDSAILRINGGQAASSTADQGTGNYGNYPLYVGRRGGTIVPFNGHLYSLIVRGAATPDTRIAQTESWVAKKTGVTL